MQPQPSKPHIYMSSNHATEGSAYKTRASLDADNAMDFGKNQNRRPNAFAGSVGKSLSPSVIAEMRNQIDHDNRARTIRSESRRIEKMQDSLKAGGHDERTAKALRENIEKARAKISAVKAEHEQAEMARIKARAEDRDRDEARQSASHDTRVVKHADHARKEDLSNRNHNRDAAEGQEDARKARHAARDNGAGL
ncbi:MAG: hypothetical protein ACYDEV_04330 [Acidiferrobacter sp.]